MTQVKKIGLLVADDDPPFRALLRTRFEGHPEFALYEAGSAEEALDWIAREEIDVAVVDIHMPGMSGVELLREAKRIDPDLEAVMLTGQGTIDTAIESMKLGAYDYLLKPCRVLDLEMAIRKAHEKRRLARENVRLREGLRRASGERPLVGDSPAMRSLRERIAKVAPLAEPVLVVGENGVGKEVVARAIHDGSPRAEAPFVTVNCGVLTEGLLEVELFGHEPDAFAGAVGRRYGLLELADGGTLYLDESDKLSANLQVRLLRFLDEGTFRRLGGTAELRADTRLIFGAGEGIRDRGPAIGVREDLYYKISTFSVTVPPLRERKGDVVPLTEQILAQTGSNGDRKRLAKKALEALEEYDWPGNVRELCNVVERAVALAPKQVIQLKDLPLTFEKRKAKNRHLLSLSEVEREHILYVLGQVNGNISKAAAILGVSRPKLYRKIEKDRTSAAGE